MRVWSVMLCHYIAVESQPVLYALAAGLWAGFAVLAFARNTDGLQTREKKY